MGKGRRGRGGGGREGEEERDEHCRIASLKINFVSRVRN